MNSRRPGLPMKRYGGAFLFLFLASSAFSVPVHAESPPLVDALFSSRQLAGWSRSPTESETKSLEMLRRGWLGLMKLGGRELSGAITQSAGLAPVSDRDFERVLDRLAQAPVRVCTDRCRCPVGLERGCVQIHDKGTLSAEVLFVDACVLDPLGCSLNRNARERGAGVMSRVLIDGAAQMILGPSRRSATNAASRIASGALRVSAAVAFVLPRLCPGPFPEGALSFLQSAGFARDISPFANRCAAGLVQPLAGSAWEALPSACRQALDESQWRRLAESARAGGVRGVRCEGFCESLTCGDARRPLPRAMIFGGKSVVSLPEETCAGGLPTREGARSFLTRTLEDLRRPSTSDASTSWIELGLRDCREALLPKDPALYAPAPASTGAASEGEGVSAEPILEIQGL